MYVTFKSFFSKKEAFSKSQKYVFMCYLKMVRINFKINSLICYILKFSRFTCVNFVVCNVTGKRYRELGLVLPALFTTLTKQKKTAMVLDNKLHQRKLKLKHLTLEHELTLRTKIFGGKCFSLRLKGNDSEGCRKMFFY